jgi:hypothetical protein
VADGTANEEDVAYSASIVVDEDSDQGIMAHTATFVANSNSVGKIMANTDSIGKVMADSSSIKGTNRYSD